MNSTISILRHHAPSPTTPFDLVVPYTNPATALPTLAAATELAHGFQAEVTLMAVHILPYPSPLECQEGIRNRLEAELTSLARAASVNTRVKLVFARDRADAYLGLLQRQSLVVIGTKRRWWRTAEERLAHKLTAGGHSVALIQVK